MKLAGKVYVSLFIGIAVLALSSAGYSYAINPDTSMTGEGILAVSPLFYAPSFKPFTSGADLYAWYGVTQNIDIAVDLADLNFSPSASYNFSSLMARYDFGGNNIIALQASQLWISPQYHFFWENDSWAFEANALAAFPYSSFLTPTIGAYIAPVYKIKKDLFYVYLEVDPFYTVGNGSGSGFTLNLLPGIWLGFGDYGQLSLACTLNNVTGTFSPGAAFWYSYSFDLKKK